MIDARSKPDADEKQDEHKIVSRECQKKKGYSGKHCVECQIESRVPNLCEVSYYGLEDNSGDQTDQYYCSYVRLLFYQYSLCIENGEYRRQGNHRTVVARMVKGYGCQYLSLFSVHFGCSRL